MNCFLCSLRKFDNEIVPLNCVHCSLFYFFLKSLYFFPATFYQCFTDIYAGIFLTLYSNIATNWKLAISKSVLETKIDYGRREQWCYYTTIKERRRKSCVFIFLSMEGWVFLSVFEIERATCLSRLCFFCCRFGVDLGW